MQESVEITVPYGSLTMETETKILNESNKVPEMPDTSCLVCNAEECSLHFGVLTCAACGAFFRRSIAAMKVYKCHNGNDCKIIHASPNQKSCRHCRLQKCLKVGMRREKVQCRREKHVQCSVAAPSDTKKRKRLENTTATGIFGRMLLQYQLLKQRRSIQYCSGQNNRFPNEAILNNSRLIWEWEPIFLSEYLGACEVFVNLAAADKEALFTNYNVVSRVVEQAYTSMMLNGIDQNRGYLLDGSYVTISEASLTQFYANGCEIAEYSQNTRILARTALPILKFNVHVLANAMQTINLNEPELVALLYIILWNPHLDELSPAAKELAGHRRNRIFHDFTDHCIAMNCDPAVRIGNLVLLLSSIQDNAFMWKQFFRLLELTKTKVLSEQLTQLLNLDMS